MCITGFAKNTQERVEPGDEANMWHRVPIVPKIHIKIMPNTYMPNIYNIYHPNICKNIYMLTRDLTLLNKCDIASLICVKYMSHNDNIICCEYALIARNTYANHMLHIIQNSRIGLTECQLYQKYIIIFKSYVWILCYTCMQHIFYFFLGDCLRSA